MCGRSHCSSRSTLKTEPVLCLSGRTPDEAADWRLLRVINQYQDFYRSGKSTAACVSSSGLAYVHEYLALDAAEIGPSVRVVVLRRPCKEVVASFMRKTVGRNHWQHPDDWEHSVLPDRRSGRGRPRWQRDKTWDRIFPNMKMPSSVPGAVTTASGSLSDASPLTALGKEEAIGAYWNLYYTVVDSLVSRYPGRVRAQHFHAHVPCKWPSHAFVLPGARRCAALKWPR